MFFILSKTISFLFLPGTLIGLAWFSYFLFKRWKFRKYLAYLGFGLFVLFTNDFLVNCILDKYQTSVTTLEPNEHYTYGILLTGMTNTLKLPKDRVYFHQNGDRMLQTLKLFYAHAFDTLIISGGGATALRDDLQEARVLKAYLKSINFPLEKVIIEDQSRNTHESAVILANTIGKRKILLISSASHLPRASKVFQKQGFLVTPYPTTFFTNDQMIAPSMFIPSADAFFKWHILFKEWMGLLAYKLAGYI